MDFLTSDKEKSWKNLAWIILRHAQPGQPYVYIDGPFLEKEDATFMVNALEMATKNYSYYIHPITMDSTVH